jgi:hypothetical protein
VKGRLWESDDDDPLGHELVAGGHAESCQESQDGHRHIGCPVWFLRRALAATGGAELAVALYLYRLRSCRRRTTVTVPNDWLQRELGVSRFTKYKALHKLEKAGLIRIHPQKGKEAIVITLCE